MKGLAAIVLLAGAMLLAAPAGTAAACGESTVSYEATGLPLAIPDNSAVTAQLPVFVAGRISDLDVGIDIQHPFDNDLKLELLAPDGSVVVLSNRHGSSGDDYAGTTFDDEAQTAIAAGAPPFSGRFRPDTVLSAIDGRQQLGTWRLRISDLATRDTGKLYGWSLTLTSVGCGLLNALPLPVLDTSPDSILSGEQVGLSGAGSLDPDGLISRYEWDLDGDGSFEFDTGTDASATAVYYTPGQVTVRLRVTDDLGGLAQTSRVITVGNRAPSAAFIATPQPAVIGRAVTIDATSSRDPDGVIERFDWDLDGNGSFETSSGTSPRVSQVYATAGTRTVRLLVTDDRGATAQEAYPLAVLKPTSTTSGGSSPGPGTGSSVGDTTAPELRILFGSRIRKRSLLRGLRLRTGCNEACSISGRLRVSRSVARRLRLGRTTFLARGRGSAASAATFAVRLRVSRRVRRRLRKAGAFKARLTLWAEDRSGNTTTFARRVKLTR